MRRVYIVDDNDAVRSSLSFYLTAAGFVTRQFSNPTKFVLTSNGLKPGCVLLDVRMPVVDGFSVLAQLSSRHAELPVIMFTGGGDAGTAVRAIRAGAFDCLEKPCDEKVLLDILRRVFVDLAALGGERTGRAKPA